MNKQLLFILAGVLLLLSCRRSIVSIQEPDTEQSTAATFSSAVEINKKLGKGMNLGGTYEGNYYSNYNTDPKVIRGYLDEIKRLGYQHVRLPIRWERSDRVLSSYPYTINPDFMNQIKKTVDYALSLGLYVVINMHNHENLFEDPHGQKEAFLSQWRQIATTFHNYPENLLFEILNEPHNNLTTDIWNTFYKEALAVIRSTPENSNNATRTVLIGLANHGGLVALPYLDLPQNDDYVIITPHYYSPFRFTHQNNGEEETAGWKGITWDDTEFERRAIENDFDYALHILSTTRLPINIGEFGAINQADEESRVKYTNFVARYLESKGFSWTYFNYHLWWGIYDVDTKMYYDRLVRALWGILPQQPPHTPLFSKEIYKSNISPSNSEGWHGWNEAGAQMNFSTGQNEIIADITNPGSNQWVLGIAKGGFKIDRGKKYSVTFTGSSTISNQFVQGTFAERQGSATESRLTSEDVVFYFSPQSKQYSFVFTALSFQENARMEFYVGGGKGPSLIKISDITVTEFYDKILLPDSEPPVPKEIILYSSNITSAAPDGWWSWGSNGAQVTQTYSNNLIQLDITNSGQNINDVAMANFLNSVGKPLRLIGGKKNIMSFRMSTTLPAQVVRCNIVEIQDPWTQKSFDITLDNTHKTFTLEHTPAVDRNDVYIEFQMGGAGQSSVIKLSDIQISYIE